MSGNYREDFPDFDAHDDIAALLSRGGHDVSWHNDACPCVAFGPEGGETLFVFVDYINPDLRESAGSDFRFGLIQPATAGQIGDHNDLQAEFATLQEVLDGLA